MTTTTPMVSVRGVHKFFGDLHVLRGIDLDIASGEVCVILGPSGSGKSTLLRCLNMLEDISAGRVYVDGELIGYFEDGSGVLNITADNEGLDTELHLTINGGNINITSGNDGINTNEDNVSVTTINDGVLNIQVTGETGEGGAGAAAIQEALADRFYALEVRDRTRMAEDLWHRAEEDSLRGLFLRELLARREAAEDEAARAEIDLAARLGLAALDHRDLG